MWCLLDCWLLLWSFCGSVFGSVCGMAVIMEKGVFRSSGNGARMVCEECSYVAETWRTVVEACSKGVDNGCLLGTGELHFSSNSSETRGFCNADEVTGSHFVSGYFSHSRATHNTHFGNSQQEVQSKICSAYEEPDFLKTSRIHESYCQDPFGEIS